jgi:hypothetical protein
MVLEVVVPGVTCNAVGDQKQRLVTASPWFEIVEVKGESVTRIPFLYRPRLTAR